MLLDSWATVLVMSSEFAKKQGFKLKKLERPMNMRNVDGSLNKEELIEHTVEATLYDYWTLYLVIATIHGVIGN